MYFHVYNGLKLFSVIFKMQLWWSKTSNYVHIIIKWLNLMFKYGYKNVCMYLWWPETNKSGFSYIPIVAKMIYLIISKMLAMAKKFSIQMCIWWLKMILFNDAMVKKKIKNWIAHLLKLMGQIFLHAYTVGWWKMFKSDVQIYI